MSARITSDRYGFEVSIVHHYRLEFDVPLGWDVDEFLEVRAEMGYEDLLEVPDFEADPNEWPSGWQQVGGDIVTDMTGKVDPERDYGYEWGA